MTDTKRLFKLIIPLLLVFCLTGCLTIDRDDEYEYYTDVTDEWEYDALERRIDELEEENEQLEETCRRLSGTLTRLKEAFDLVGIDLIEFGEFTQEELNEFWDMGYVWWDY